MAEKIPTIVDVSKIDALKIADYIKKNYSGEEVQKIDIISKFNLPYTRSRLIWSMMQDMGFISGRGWIKWELEHQEPDASSEQH